MSPTCITPSELKSLLEREILPEVRRPGRYIGSELNMVKKDHSTLDVTLALAFPDVYEIGMSNLGIQILYEIVNKLEWAAAERVFAPWVDMEQKLREKALPLYSLETFTPLKDFDIVGFSLAYELCYTNVLNMLDLGGIPLRFEERCSAGGPLVIAGGLGALVPEPMWEFIDLFVVGEAEDAIVELLQEFRAGGFREKIRSNPSARIEFLRTMAQKHEGIYVPHFYRVEYTQDAGAAIPPECPASSTLTREEDDAKKNILRSLEVLPGCSNKCTTEATSTSDFTSGASAIPGKDSSSTATCGTIAKIEPKDSGVPPVVRKRVVRDLSEAVYPEKPIVPFLDVVHDRAVVEIMRGCGRGCRFCQAGAVYRPVRELPLPEVIKRAGRLVQVTGHEEISLSSLSTGDYGQIEELLSHLSGRFRDSRTAISLPSLRPDTFSITVLEKVRATKKTGITLAVEAATTRLRKVINKRLEDQDVLEAARAAYEHGWNLIKLYFMIGLPTETDEDILALAKLVQEIGDARKSLDGRRGQVNVSVACFVPKAHTPFQWEKFHSILDLERKILYIKGLVKGRNIKLKFHDPKKTYLEAVLSRGDRRLSTVIHRAWSRGCRLDDWTEHFSFERWMEAFRESNIDPDFYASRERASDEILPWDHISCGVSKDSLKKERERAMG